MPLSDNSTPPRLDKTAIVNNSPSSSRSAETRNYNREKTPPLEYPPPTVYRLESDDSMEIDNDEPSWDFQPLTPTLPPYLVPPLSAPLQAPATFPNRKLATLPYRSLPSVARSSRPSQTLSQVLLSIHDSIPVFFSSPLREVLAEARVELAPVLVNSNWSAEICLTLLNEHWLVIHDIKSIAVYKPLSSLTKSSSHQQAIIRHSLQNVSQAIRCKAIVANAWSRFRWEAFMTDVEDLLMKGPLLTKEELPVAKRRLDLWLEDIARLT